MEHQPTVVHKRCRPSLTSATPPSTPSSPCSMYALLFLSFLFSSSFLLFFLSFLFIILLYVLLSFFILPRRYSNEYATGYKGWDVGRQLHSGTLCLFSSSLLLSFLSLSFFFFFLFLHAFTSINTTSALPMPGQWTSASMGQHHHRRHLSCSSFLSLAVSSPLSPLPSSPLLPLPSPLFLSPLPSSHIYI